MNLILSIPIEAFAIAGPGAQHAADSCRVELPPPGTKRKGGRLPLLAAALARRATDTPHESDTPDASAAVLFGTSLGCLTETGLFVEHMIEADEATPKPRAFSSSVHNAIASKVAMDLGAHGPCQTFVHGEASFGHALLAGCLIARRTSSPVYVGALDETSKFVDRALAGCGLPIRAAEGGAVLRLGQERVTDPRAPGPRVTGPRAPGPRVTGPRVTRIGCGGNPSASSLRDATAIVTVPGFDGAHPELAAVIATTRVPPPSRAPFEHFHPSLTATAVALAAGIFRGDVPPAALGLRTIPADITLVTKTRFGDHTAIRIEG